MQIVRRIAFIMMIFALVAGFILWNHCYIELEEITVQVDALPEAFSSMRIAVLADLHGREFGKDNTRLLEHIEAADPDLICICGDLIDSEADVGILPPLISGLSRIAPTYYVSGNHEWQLDDPEALFRSIETLGATVLRNDFVILERNGQRIAIAGVDDPCGPYDQKSPEVLMQELQEVPCVIMLDHRNNRLPMWAELGTDLVLSGHCHGGVVRLPFVGGLFGTNRELFPDYDSGLYEKNGTTLFVSRGLGFTNVKVRLFNRPQIAVLTLVNNS